MPAHAQAVSRPWVAPHDGLRSRRDIGCSGRWDWLWIAALIVGVALRPNLLFAWGSTISSTDSSEVGNSNPHATHQFIESRAYDRVVADKAFSEGFLPTLDAILESEGMSVETVWGFPPSLNISGNSPDVDGNSQYSWHWYNPRLPQNQAGKGPDEIRNRAITFVKSRRANAKAGDWAAHFMADMSTPVHMFGIDKAGIDKIFDEAQKTGGELRLPENIVGPAGLTQNWMNAVLAFRAAVSNSTTVDYFDPWYYDQWPNTHAWWETENPKPDATRNDADYKGTYNSDWKNSATPSFDKYAEDYGSNAYALAVTAAITTRDNFTTLSNCNVQAALKQSIENVATIWRASFSAMRPQADITSDPGAANIYVVTARVENVESTHAAGAVSVRLTVQNGEIIDGDATNSVGDIPPKSTSNPTSWKIKVKDPARCRLIVEAIGYYKDVPDLQYAISEQGLPIGPVDLVFCIDLTASMSDDIDQVKVSAVNIIAKLAERTKDFRIAIVGYRDWPEEGTTGPQPPMFVDFPFTPNREAVIGSINSLSVAAGGDIPEAVLEALMRAIDSKTIGGWRNNVNKQIIQMGDAPPHDPSRAGLTAAIVAQAAYDADPVVIHSVIVANGGVFDTNAVTSLSNLAKLTGGVSCQAKDAASVPAAILSAIQSIKPIEPVAVTNKPPPPPPPDPVAVKPTFELKSKQVKSGAEIVVKLGSLPPPDKRPVNAWIGFYKEGADNQNYISYTFLKNLNNDTYDVPVPGEAGKYNFRVFFDESYQAAGISDTVEVKQP